MKGFIANIEELTVKNSAFRQVLFTGQHAQLVIMSLEPNMDIGEEVHEIVDQFIRIESGEAKAIIDGEEAMLKAGDVIVVPAGTRHNIMNTSSSVSLKLYTIYTPPHHKPGTRHETKRAAEADTSDHI